MPRLVTGLFYERSEAEDAVEALKARQIPGENITLEPEVTPPVRFGRTDGATYQVEKERRVAGVMTGLIIGGSAGCIVGMGVSILGSTLAEMTRVMSEKTITISPFLANPLLASLAGIVMGLFAGGIIGWFVDYTLNTLGAGPPLPQHEALVTVRADEDRLNEVFKALEGAHASHLHVEASRN